MCLLTCVQGVGMGNITALDPGRLGCRFVRVPGLINQRSYIYTKPLTTTSSYWNPSFVTRFLVSRTYYIIEHPGHISGSQSTPNSPLDTFQLYTSYQSPPSQQFVRPGSTLLLHLLAPLIHQHHPRPKAPPLLSRWAALQPPWCLPRQIRSRRRPSTRTTSREWATGSRKSAARRPGARRTGGPTTSTRRRRRRAAARSTSLAAAARGTDFPDCQHPLPLL